ncbi:MAG: DUF3127 domain-containing protein [Bacteroidetes bacterium]|jgi:sulfur relay (sulfurtransferase) DsrF/TusC family protein|nr:DUF3127 domain-containing protein [Bacteroidota bacterium]
MSYEMKGKLHKKFDTDQKTDTFQARDFVVLLEDERYPQYIKFQLVQDRCSLIDNYEEGQDLVVHFDLRGREWNEKYFTNLNAWKIETPAGVEQATSSDVPDLNEADVPGNNQDAEAAAPPDGSDEDDLPF